MEILKELDEKRLFFEQLILIYKLNDDKCINQERLQKIISNINDYQLDILSKSLTPIFKDLNKSLKEKWGHRNVMFFDYNKKILYLNNYEIIEDLHQFKEYHLILEFFQNKDNVQSKIELILNKRKENKNGIKSS